MIACAPEEGGQLGGALVVALLAPVDGGIVHLVDDDDELVDALGFGQHGVLSRLAASLEPGFVLALPGRDDEDTDIGLGGAANHVGHIVLVAGSIEHRVPPLLGLEECAANLDRLALGSLLAGEVESPRQVPRLTAGFLCFAPEFFHGPLVNHACGIEDRTTKRRLPGVNVPNKDKVYMLLFFFYIVSL